VSSKDRSPKPNLSRRAVVGIALIGIVIGGPIGAVIGSGLGSTTNGFRVGVVLGAAIVFTVVQLKKRRRAS
jgi:predicted MFS family arabinose efflux permease